MENKRQPCQVVTRVMGYFRPVSFYNKGKKAEFYSRTYFESKKAKDTSRFLNKFNS